MSQVSTCAACGEAYAGPACVRCMAKFADEETEFPTPEIPGIEVLEEIGRGGMGVVYRARQGGRVVALKVLSIAEAARFRREAKAMAALAHPNIVPRYEAGDDYFTMEYVEGTDLRRLLRRGALSPAEALRIAREVCAALEYAHRQGVLHRDLKPENVLLDAKGTVRLADFGLAKVSGASAITKTGAVLGTARYMAPEQSAGRKDLDARADLYSLGAILYEMLTGQAPAGDFQPPSKIAEVDPAFDRIALRLLQTDRARRHPDAAALLADLEKLAKRWRST